MPNVKPGDLCLVVGDKVKSDIIGMIVEVVGPAPGNEFYAVEGGGYIQHGELTNGRAWEVKSEGKSLPWTNGRFCKTYKMLSRPVADRFLIKIKDSDLTLDEESEISKNTPLTKEKETT